MSDLDLPLVDLDGCCDLDGVSAVDSKPSIVRPVIDDVRISVLVSSYNHHFAKYSESHSKTTQLVPNAVWKEVAAFFIVYSIYQINCFRCTVIISNNIRNVALKKPV